MFGHDPARSGVDEGDRILTLANVAKLRARWQIQLSNAADSTPVTLGSMLFQTTESGVTYGIDANTGRIAWRFATHGPPRITNSTPAADASDGTIYVPGIDGFVHHLDAVTGRELRGRGFPLRITLMPSTEKDAAALNLANGYLYAATSGYIGDAPPYDGHVVAISLSTGSVRVFNSLCSRETTLPTPASCSQQRSGIWSRGGVVVDPDPAMGGRIYVATGNGDFNHNAGGDDFGDSVVSLRADAGSMLGSYTPTNYASLDEHDVDLGSTSPALIPRQPQSRTPLMLVQGGKDRILRLLDRAHLPGLGGELQRLDVGHLFASPAVWTDSGGGVWVYLGLRKSLDAFRLTTGAGGVSRLAGAWQVPVTQLHGEGTSPAVSNGIVFEAQDGAIVAFDALTGHVVWSSAQRSALRSIGPVHWQSPIVANGRVYCSDENGRLTAYALP